MRKAWLVLFGAIALGACAHPATTEVAHTIVAAALPGPQLDGALGSTTVPAFRDSLVTARLSIDSHTGSHTPRPALNVALCLDTSGSMEGKAIEDARAAALAFVAGIQPGDGFSLVTFDSTVRVVVPPTHMSQDTDLAPIRAAIRGIRAQGTTDMQDGLRTAIQNVQALYDPSRVNRVVLVSDGVPNEGTQLRALAQQAEHQGISLSAMGLGLDYDEILMGDLAQTGGGRFKYIDDSSKIAGYLSDELTRISRVSARSATLEIEPGPGVAVESIVGLPSSPTGRGGLFASLGDVSLGSHRDVFFRLRAHGRRDGAAVELADATLRYVASDGASHEEHFFFGAHASTSDDAVAKSKNDDVERGALAAQKAADAIEAIRKARETDQARRAPIPNGRPQPAPAPMSLDLDVTKREHAAAMRTLLGD